MSRVNPRTINDLGFFVQSENTLGCTGGHEDLGRFGLPHTLKAVLGSIMHAGHYMLVTTDRSTYVGLVNLAYKDIYVTKHELDVLEGYVPVPEFCEFGFKKDPSAHSLYHSLGFDYPLQIQFGPTVPQPLPSGATLLSEPFLWYRNYLMPGTGKLRGPTRRLTLRETRQRPVFPAPPADEHWYRLRAPSDPGPPLSAEEPR